MLFRRNISRLTDEELLAAYKKSGNTEYFGELYNRYTPLLYGVCLKYLNGADKAQDAVMQLFENLLPKISNYEIANAATITTPTPWLDGTEQSITVESTPLGIAQS